MHGGFDRGKDVLVASMGERRRGGEGVGWEHERTEGRITVHGMGRGVGWGRGLSRVVIGTLYMGAMSTHSYPPLFAVLQYHHAQH